MHFDGGIVDLGTEAINVVKMSQGGTQYAQYQP